jgi:hypothetical protein
MFSCNITLLLVLHPWECNCLTQVDILWGTWCCSVTFFTTPDLHQVCLVFSKWIFTFNFLHWNSFYHSFISVVFFLWQFMEWNQKCCKLCSMLLLLWQNHTIQNMVNCKLYMQRLVRGQNAAVMECGQVFIIFICLLVMSVASHHNVHNTNAMYKNRTDTHVLRSSSPYNLHIF